MSESERAAGTKRSSTAMSWLPVPRSPATSQVSMMRTWAAGKSMRRLSGMPLGSSRGCPPPSARGTHMRKTPPAASACTSSGESRRWRSVSAAAARMRGASATAASKGEGCGSRRRASGTGADHSPISEEDATAHWIRRAKRLGGEEEVAMSLTAKQCTPCRGGVPPLSRAEAERLLRETPGWTLDADATRIERTFKTADFAAALALVEQIAAIAEAEGHHPDIGFGWGYCRGVFY